MPLEHDQRFHFPAASRSARRSPPPQMGGSPRTMLVDGPRNPLFAGAAFAENQNDTFGGCDSSDGFINFHYCGTLANDSPGGLAFDFHAACLYVVVERSLR